MIYSFNHLIGLKTMVPGEESHSDVDFDFLRWMPDTDTPLVNDVSLEEEVDPGPADAGGAGPKPPLVPKWCREQKPTPFHKIHNPGEARFVENYGQARIETLFYFWLHR